MDFSPKVKHEFFKETQEFRLTQLSPARGFFTNRGSLLPAINSYLFLFLGGGDGDDFRSPATLL